MYSNATRYNLSWREVGGMAQWETLLAAFNGHPLQSVAWGDARRRVEGLESIYLMAESNGEPYGLARIETRNLPLLGKVAWIPRGPVLVNGVPGDDAGLSAELRRRGFMLAIDDVYRETSRPSNVRTIWIDLSLGIEVLQRRIDKQWMYGVRRAAREGVNVIEATTCEEVAQFYCMCEQISHDKGFELPGSESLMQELLLSPQIEEVEMRLFLATYHGKIGAGAFVARSGQHLHYFWGASDRSLSRQRVGEAVQWAVIEWGTEIGCSRYDLEGIDPVKNAGVYAFKKKMGGEEITLAGKRIHALNLIGKVAVLADRAFGKI